MSLTDHDLSALDGLLRNEADMAFRRRTLRLMEWLDLQHEDEILDCGCGMGFQLKVMSSLRAPRLTGCDGAFDRLVRARSEAPAARVVQVDLHQLPFAEASFDKALMTEVLEHLKQDEEALRGIWKVLRPGGVLAISVPHARYPFLWDPINWIWTGLGGSPIRGNTIAGIWSGHERLYEPEQLVRVVERAGFLVEDVEEATHFCFPLIHFLVYGIGRPLLERGYLPPSLVASSDRFSGHKNNGSLLNPVNAGRALFRLFDERNDTASVRNRKTFVNVLLKARKPSGSINTARSR